MYIPRPAKLLFQIDDGWGKLLDKHGHSIPAWTQLVIERMLACGTPTMGSRRYCCTSPHCSHTKYICRSCKGEGCSACGMKATEQWIAEQQHILPDCEWQHVTFTMPDKLWPTFANNWPRLTARVIMPSTTFQLSLSCFLTASTVLIFSHESTNDLNSRVYRLPGPAHGTGRVWQPCSGHITRGTSASTNVMNWQVSRWRHLRCR